MLRIPAGAVCRDRQAGRELNVTLINRGHSFEGLTPEGERLVVWARRILAEHDAFKAEVDAVRSGITGTLRLGTVPTASTTASLVLSAFCSAHPLVKVQILSRLAATELYRRLREFELDAAIVHAAPDEADVNLVPLYQERYVLLSPAEMLGSGAATMTWAQAAQLPLALLTPDMRDRQIIDKAFDDHGITVSPQVETDSVASLFAQASAGKWASIVPHTWLWTSRWAGGPGGGDARSGAQGRRRVGDQRERTRFADRACAGGVGRGPGAERVFRRPTPGRHPPPLTAAARAGFRPAR